MSFGGYIDFFMFHIKANGFLIPGLYMMGYGRRKFILKLPPFLIMNEELQEQENSKHQMKTKTFLLLFSFDFEFPALEVPRSYQFQKGGNFKINLLFPYPII